MSVHSLISRFPKPVKDAVKERIYPPLLQEGEVVPE